MFSAVVIPDLVRELAVSRAGAAVTKITVRRDLKLAATRGLLRRTGDFAERLQRIAG